MKHLLKSVPLALALLTIISMLGIPKDARAVCSSEERIDMAMDGMSEPEINRECNARGPIGGSVCGTLHGKCRLPRPQEFNSSCYCIDEYGRRQPGKTQQY